MIAAILFPVFARASNGNSSRNMDVHRIAWEIDRYHHREGQWPTRFEDLEPLLGSRPQGRSFRISILALDTKPDSADYVIAVNDRLGHVQTQNGRLTDLRAPVISGDLPARKP